MPSSMAPLRDVQEAASHAHPRTIRYDRARGSLDRHAARVVATFVAAPTAPTAGYLAARAACRARRHAGHGWDQGWIMLCAG